MTSIRRYGFTLSFLVLWLCACSAPRPDPAVGATTRPEAEPAAPPKRRNAEKSSTQPTSAEPLRTAPDVFKAPPGLIRLNDPERGPQPGRSTCGAYRVDYRRGPAPDGSSVAILDDKGKTVRDFGPKGAVVAWYPQWCFDVTGDGVPELTLTSRTGGKSWRFRHTLLSLSQPMRELLVYDEGPTTGHALDPINLDGKGAFELVDTDDVLWRLAPGERTRLLPVVFAYEKDRYVRATRRHSDYIEQLRADILSTCRHEVCWEDGGTELLALSLLIGDWDRFKQETPVPPSLLPDLEVLRKKLDPNLE